VIARSARLFELARFGFVGAGSTVVYGAISLALLAFGVAPAAASALAYATSGLLAYWGHKHFTYRSGGAHAREAPRFILANAFGFALALAAPGIAARVFHVGAVWAILFTCVAVPAISYFAMRRLVFTSGRGGVRAAPRQAV
jgi:putative flippase GtrA